MPNNLSQYVEMYRQASELDTDVLWQKVKTIREAVADGADVPTLLAECGKESGDKAEQVQKFYAVAMIFDDKAIAQNYSYWLYQNCATVDDRINVEDINTYHYAYEWLDEVEKRVTKENGVTIHGMHTPQTLKSKIQRANRKRRAANGQPKAKPETVFKGTTTFQGFDMDYSLILAVPFVAVENHLKDLTIGTPLQIVITRAPQPAAVEDAKEAVA